MDSKINDILLDLLDETFSNAPYLTKSEMYSVQQIRTPTSAEVARTAHRCLPRSPFGFLAQELVEGFHRRHSHSPSLAGSRIDRVVVVDVIVIADITAIVVVAAAAIVAVVIIVVVIAALPAAVAVAMPPSVHLPVLWHWLCCGHVAVAGLCSARY